MCPSRFLSLSNLTHPPRFMLLRTRLHRAVSGISHEGLLDGLTGKVKWGFFFDSDPRVLAYTDLPPINDSRLRIESRGFWV